MTTIYGGSGNEVIHGGAGDNILYGGSGQDEIYGGTGPNWMYGNGADDILQGGSGGSDENYIDPRGGSGLAGIEVKNDENQPTFDGTMDANGNSYLGDYRAVDPGYQGGGSAAGGCVGVVDWTFYGVDSGVRLGEDEVTPLAVYVNWKPGAALRPAPSGPPTRNTGSMPYRPAAT